MFIFAQSLSFGVICKSNKYQMEVKWKKLVRSVARLVIAFREKKIDCFAGL